MNGNALAAFVCQIRLQLDYLNGEQGDYEYAALEVYLYGASDPWEIYPGDKVEFPEGTGLLIFRADPEEWDNAEVPENAIRLDAIVATRLV